MQRLRPCDIRYSQDSISNTFSYPGQKIGEVLDDIYYGRLDIDYIPKISVVKVSGSWVSRDNRRLWVFKQLERLGKCSEVPVDVEWESATIRMTSRNSGTDVKVRGDPGGKCHKMGGGYSWMLWAGAAVVGLLILGRAPQ